MIILVNYYLPLKIHDAYTMKFMQVHFLRHPEDRHSFFDLSWFLKYLVFPYLLI